MPSESTEPGGEPLLVGDGGLQHRPEVDAHSLRSLFELMDLVEALCPSWPAQRSFEGWEFRL